MTNKQFTVMNHEYINTGGNCMVSIFTVYDCIAKQVKYVMVNESTLAITSFDYISNELPDSLDYPDVDLGNYEWDALTCDPSFDQHQFTDEEHELYKYCQFEYIKKDCSYFDTKYRLSEDQFPHEMISKISAHCIEWHRNEETDFLTDGYEVYPSEYYVPEEDVVDERLQAAIEFNERVRSEAMDFNEWLTTAFVEGWFTEDSTECFFKEALLIVGGRVLKIPLHADSFELLQTFIEDIADCHK